jgi:predicted nucleotidyltransferase
MPKKPERRLEWLRVIYDAERWDLLEELRRKSERIMKALEIFHSESVVLGSIARGDVNKKSDVDVFIYGQPSSFIVEMALEKAGIPINRRLIVQATPTYAMKAYIETVESASVSFPLMKMRTVEKEFYKFGGEATLENLRKGLRACGVDKRLMLIEPNKKGHLESSIIGREQQTARLLGISAETVLDRVHALLRRDEVGRTGVFIEKELLGDENFEMALEKLADHNPAVRRRLRAI